MKSGKISFKLIESWKDEAALIDIQKRELYKEYNALKEKTKTVEKIKRSSDMALERSKNKTKTHYNSLG